MPGKTKVLYVAGLGRSGSTILGNVLGGVEGFFHGGELNFVWEHNLLENRLCGCGAPFDECVVWRNVFEEAFGGMDGVDAREMARLQHSGTRTRHVPLMLSARGRRALDARLQKYVARLGGLYGAIARSTGSSVVVDTSKFPSYGWALGRAQGVELYVLHLVRDPRAAAYSWLKNPKPDTYMDRVGVARSSLLWDAWNVSAEALFGGTRGRYMRLRYEDFVSQPRRAVAGIVAMLGEEGRDLPFVGEGEVGLEAGHTVAGNPNRFRTGTVRLRPDDEWTRGMRFKDRATATLITLPLLGRYGYPIWTG